MNLSGTPKTFDEAIEQALCIGPLTGIKERMYHIGKDFMAQKFATAFLKAGDDEKLIESLRELYEHLTRRTE